MTALRVQRSVAKSLCTTFQPFCTRLSRRFGGSVSEVTMGPNPKVPLENVRLYDDSLSGWVRDPSLPMEPMAKL